MVFDWINALILLFVGLISLVVLLPIYNQLMPFIESTMGSTVVLVASSAILLLVAGLIYNFVLDSKQSEYGG